MTRMDSLAEAYASAARLGKEIASYHPLYKILHRQPNAEMSSFSFFEMVMISLLLHGNAYVQIIRDGKNNVLELYPILPDRMEIDRDDSGKIYYIYHAYTDEKAGAWNKDIIFRREDILHIPGLGFNGLVGFSPIAMMKNALGSCISVDKYGAAFFRNGAQPIGVLQHPGILKDPAKVREAWQEAYGGPGNHFRTAVLEEGMTYQSISLPPEDSQFLETKQFSVTEICRIFRVPPHMVQDLSRATFSNIEHQSISFVQNTLMPWLVRIEQAIIKDLLLEEEKDEFFPKFNVDGMLRGDYASRMSGYSTAFSNAIMTPNEIRRLENLDPIPAEEGGDDLYLNGSYTKLKDAGKAYDASNSSAESQQEQQTQQTQTEQTEEEQEEPEESEESEDEKDEKDSENRHSERHASRKSERRGR